MNGLNAVLLYKKYINWVKNAGIFAGFLHFCFIAEIFQFLNFQICSKGNKNGKGRFHNESVLLGIQIN